MSWGPEEWRVWRAPAVIFEISFLLLLPLEGELPPEQNSYSAGVTMQSVWGPKKVSFRFICCFNHLLRRG